MGARVTLATILCEFEPVLQDALNTIWGVKPKPGLASLVSYARFLSFAMVGGICFLLLVSRLTIESVLKGFSHYVQSAVPGGIVEALATYWIFDLGVVVLLFACIFKFLPSRLKIQWRDVWRALLARHFSLPSVSGRLAITSQAGAPPRLMERPARLSRFCSRSITLRRSCSSAQSSPKCMRITQVAGSRRTSMRCGSKSRRLRLTVS